MENKKILAGQSVFDIALQETGDTSAAFSIANRNLVGLTDSLQPGLLLKVEPDTNDPVVVEYLDSQITPATALEDGLIPEGIGYMCVETDFIVS